MTEDHRYNQYCPIARAAEIVADRWTPLIVRELVNGSHRFNELVRGLPGINRSLLVARLARLERAGVIERRPAASRGDEYWLTAMGMELGTVLEQLGAWSARWAFGEPRLDELDPVLLLWWIQRRVDVAALPPGRVVVRFDFRGRALPLWLVLERPGPSACLQDPGFATDLVVDADLAAFYEVWLGRIPLAAAQAAGRVQLNGPPTLSRAFPRWLLLSPMAPSVRSAPSSSASAVPTPRMGIPAD